MQNGEWGLVGKVAIVTGGGAADDGIGNGRAAQTTLFTGRVPDSGMRIGAGSGPIAEESDIGS